MRRIALLVACSLVTSEAFADDQKKAPAPLPKPAQRAGDSVSAAKVMPPFFGLFGPPELLAKTGFRSQIGRYVEFELREKEGGGVKAGAMRIQEVGPTVRGARWIELIGEAPGVQGSAGLRMLTRGLGEGNIERLIASAPNFPPLEVPLESASLEQLQGGMPGGVIAGKVSLVGKEKLTVPLGTFATTHYKVEGAQAMELWVTDDANVPFSGAIKMISPDGVALATKVGVDAVAQIPVPPKAR